MTWRLGHQSMGLKDLLWTLWVRWGGGGEIWKGVLTGERRGLVWKLYDFKRVWWSSNIWGYIWKDCIVLYCREIIDIIYIITTTTPNLIPIPQKPLYYKTNKLYSVKTTITTNIKPTLWNPHYFPSPNPQDINAGLMTSLDERRKGLSSVAMVVPVVTKPSNQAVTATVTTTAATTVASGMNKGFTRWKGGEGVSCFCWWLTKYILF